MGLEITAKIFFSLPEGQLHVHLQLLPKIHTQVPITVRNQGVFGLCNFGKQTFLCSAARLAPPGLHQTQNRLESNCDCTTQSLPTDNKRNKLRNMEQQRETVSALLKGLNGVPKAIQLSQTK
jgi:hypothetical protein